MLRRIWHWWRGEWDYLLIVGCLLVIALTVGGIISVTLDAIQYARAYH